LNYADYTAPLLKLLRKEQVWKWTQIEQTAFTNLRNCFAQSVQLIHPKQNLGYAVYTDASKLGISAILTQRENEDEVSIISTASRVLTPTEQRYTTCEQELLAVVYSFQKFGIYVTGHPTTVYSDNKALSFLKKCQITSSRVARWIMQLQEFDVTIQHVKGTDNHFADVLSRNPIGINGEVKNQSKGNNEYLVAKLDLEIDKSLARDFRVKMLKNHP
jgi:hypothetical protein